jgi:sarcosine oxidase delta subunit
MKNLRQVYEEGRNVRDSDIPEIWKESWNQFIMGQACQAETNEDGTVKEFIYYSHDFRRWYHMNQQAIERDIKIDQFIK